MNRIIDHIVYAVPNLEVALQDFEAKTGIRPVFGGYHQTKGTKNALVNLGNKCYLEFLAIDKENTAISSPRWMGIDHIETPTITRWALKSQNLAHDSQVVQVYNPKMGELQTGQRKMSKDKLLTWQMTLPLAAPAVEIMPFFLDWSASEVHPTEQLEEQCKLLDIKVTHPSAESLQAIFTELKLDVAILEGETAAIQMRLDTPKGIVSI